MLDCSTRGTLVFFVVFAFRFSFSFSSLFLCFFRTLGIPRWYRAGHSSLPFLIRLSSLSRTFIISFMTSWTHGLTMDSWTLTDLWTYGLTD